MHSILPVLLLWPALGGAQGAAGAAFDLVDEFFIAAFGFASSNGIGCCTASSPALWWRGGLVNATGMRYCHRNPGKCEPQDMTLKVIGTGFGRTGTDSMREALDILGFGPTHHMFAVLGNPQATAAWRDVAAGATPDWPALFASYHSCVDWPSAFYWRQLIAAYPDAKVILTLRSAESWWESVNKTLLPALRNSTDPASLGVALIAKQVFAGGDPFDRAHAIATFEANNAAVQAEVPAARLLVHNLGDGWVPLCAHLGVAVPSTLYPSRNSAGEFSIAPKS